MLTLINKEMLKKNPLAKFSLKVLREAHILPKPGFRINDFKNLDLYNMVQIVSWGGAGTTTISFFLEEHGINVPRNKFAEDWHPWKHIRVPPSESLFNKGFRTIYLFSDPMDTVLSVFRRNFQNHHIDRMRCKNLPEWNYDWGLQEYLENGQDLFQMEDHLRNWLNAKRTYPIMFIRFEYLWEHLPEFFAFTGLSYDLMDEFPKQKKRNSNWRDEKPEIQERLLAIYGSLGEFVESLPPIFVKSPITNINHRF